MPRTTGSMFWTTADTWRRNVTGEDIEVDRYRHYWMPSMQKRPYETYYGTTDTSDTHLKRVSNCRHCFRYLMKIVLFLLVSVLMIATYIRSMISVRLDCPKFQKRYYFINHLAFKHGREVRLASILPASNLLTQGFYTQIVLIMKIVRIPYNPHRRTASLQT